MPEIAEFTLDATLPHDAKSVIQREDGDLIIEGYASDFGIDRQDEAFEPGAFSKGIEAFLSGTAPLLYHHHNDQQLGRVLELEPRSDGLWMKAIVAKPAATSPLLDTYEKIRRGMMRGLSVRGFFRKRSGPGGTRIHEADLAEISVTPIPVNPRTLFEVAQKAFDEADEDLEAEAAALRARLQAKFDDAQKALDDLVTTAGSVLGHE